MSRKPCGSPRWAAALLPCVNLVLMVRHALLLALYLLEMVAGASLATAARLTWDPSASIPLRLVLPLEHRVATALLTAGPLALLAMALLAQASLHATRRRPMLLTFVAGMVVLMVCEAAAGAWLAVRVHHFATHVPLVPELMDLLHVGDVLRGELNDLLRQLDHYIPVSKVIEAILRKLSPQVADLLFSEEFQKLLQEIPRDVPCNVHVGAACVLLCAALQPLAALLALLAARRDSDTRALSCVRSNKATSSLPRCLRPTSTGNTVADELPMSTSRTKDKEHTLRTAPRSRGWALQPGAGWARG